MNTKMKERIKKSLGVLIVTIIGFLANKGFIVASILEKTLVTIGIILTIYIFFMFAKTAYIVLKKHV